MTEFDFVAKYRAGFAVSELGRINSLLPLSEMASAIAIRFPKRNPQGKKPMFSLEGEIALMSLKSYTGLSDDGLIEMLNGGVYMQMFCSVLLDPSNPIKDGKIVSAIRNRLAGKLDIKALQKVLCDKWQDRITDKDLCLTDATCYESLLRFPTDVKMHWECCEWLQPLMAKTCKELKERLARNKYNDINKARLAYAKQRKYTSSATLKLRCRLLHHLTKQIFQWNNICRQFRPVIILSAEQEKPISALKEVCRQQRDMIEKKELKVYLFLGNFQVKNDMLVFDCEYFARIESEYAEIQLLE